MTALRRAAAEAAEDGFDVEREGRDSGVAERGVGASVRAAGVREVGGAGNSLELAANAGALAAGA